MADPANTGIYEIVNLVNGKRYIGSAKSLSNRRGQHWTRLKNGWHHNRKLQNSWNKHGARNFQFRVLLLCRISDLLLYEQIAIDRLKPELNICPTAGSTLGRTHSEETRAKIAARKIGLKLGPRSAEHRAALSKAQKGKPKDPDHLEKFQLGRRKFTRSEEQCAAVSRSMKLAYEDGRHRRDRPPEYREKIAATLRGVKHSEERRAKQAAAQVGLKRKPYVIKPRTPEQQARIDAGRLAGAAKTRGQKRSPEVVAQMSLSRKGRKRDLSPEQRAKMSLALKARWAAKREEILVAQAVGRLTMDKTHLIESGRRLGALSKGSKRTPEQRAARSARMLGKKRGPYKRTDLATGPT